jgi:hypothetical protein
MRPRGRDGPVSPVPGPGASWLKVTRSASPYARICAGAVARRIPRGCYGTGLAAIPYVQLPRHIDQENLLIMPPARWLGLQAAAA